MLLSNPDNRKEQRLFGILVAAGLLAAGLLRWTWAWFFHDEPPELPLLFWGVAAVIGVIALVVPSLLRHPLAFWLRLVAAIDWLLTRVLLGLAFFLVLTPVGWIMRTFGNDPLKREWKPDAASYWEDAEPAPDDPEAYRHPF